MEQFSVYIHVPFCMKRCYYCDFLSFSDMQAVHEEYVQKLCEELKLCPKKYAKDPVHSVFIGGGTPTCLSMGLFEKLLSAVAKTFNLSSETEYTVEANPETLNLGRLELMKKYKVNRLSIGVQSMDDKQLELIGRVHDSERVNEAFSFAKAVGFENINLDLIFGLPGQTNEIWQNTLNNILELNPEHVSCYSLTLEDGSKMSKDNSLVFPSEEQERNMYYTAKKTLKNAGYEHYEISNFAKKGFECKHNIVYWSQGNYLSAGLGAHSFVNGVRYQNTINMQEYLGGDFSKREQIVLTDKDKYSEYMFLGLRMIKGVSEMEFRSKYRLSMRKFFGKSIEKLVNQGLLSDDGERVMLTDKGMDLANIVFMEMLLDY